LKSFVVDGLGDGEAQPRRRVAESESPNAAHDLFGPFDGADALGLHRVTDGDVPLDRERRQTQRRRVDSWQENKKVNFPIFQTLLFNLERNESENVQLFQRGP
jgi:hypothetical protein